MQNFSHSLKIIDQDEIADVAFHNWNVFISEGKSFFNFKHLYIYIL